jgi:hypothetical protein
MDTPVACGCTRSAHSNPNRVACGVAHATQSGIAVVVRSSSQATSSFAASRAAICVAAIAAATPASTDVVVYTFAG